MSCMAAMVAPHQMQSAAFRALSLASGACWIIAYAPCSLTCPTWPQSGISAAKKESRSGEGSEARGLRLHSHKLNQIVKACDFHNRTAIAHRTCLKDSSRQDLLA